MSTVVASKNIVCIGLPESEYDSKLVDLKCYECPFDKETFLKFKHYEHKTHVTMGNVRGHYGVNRQMFFQIFNNKLCNASTLFNVTN